MSPVSILFNYYGYDYFILVCVKFRVWKSRGYHQTCHAVQQKQAPDLARKSFTSKPFSGWKGWVARHPPSLSLLFPVLCLPLITGVVHDITASMLFAVILNFTHYTILFTVAILPTVITRDVCSTHVPHSVIARAHCCFTRYDDT